MPASPQPPAQRSVAEFLRLADARLPGVVQGLHLVGSVALDDVHAGVSDVDFPAVTAEPPDDAVLDGLERIHRRPRLDADRPSFDGAYLRREHLSGHPELARPASFHLGGQFHRRERTFELNPAVWALLHDRGVAARGPAPSEPRIASPRSG